MGQPLFSTTKTFYSKLSEYLPGDSWMTSILVFGMIGRAQSPAQIQTVKM